MDKIELLGGACFSHGPYTFYKAVRIGNGRVLRLGNFFLTKLWTDADLVSIGELQLLWIDSRGSNQPLASLRLYFLPENTPDGRRDTHGEDEVLTISEKVVVRVHDLVTWLSPNLNWSWGREVAFPPTPGISPDNNPQKFDGTLPQILTDPGIDFADVDKQQKDYENNSSLVKQNDVTSVASQTRVVVLSYPRYCRYRALLRRLEGREPAWLCSSVAAALGGFTALPGTRILFCRDTFDYPDLETHELLCNHLAPKLKGRPRRKRKKRSVSPGESSNESEASVASTSNSSILRPPSAGVRRSERKPSSDEKKFLNDVYSFMSARGTPVGKMPLLGYRQIDLYMFYTKVHSLGGYDAVSAGRLWKTVYDDIGGNITSTSAATITRRHYERLLLPYERHQKGDETRLRPAGRRTKSTSEETTEMKQESRSETPQPAEIESPTADTNVEEIFSPISMLTPIDKPKTEVKPSSLRSVRVKPERLKSLSTIISGQNPPPSPPPSSNSSSTSTSTSSTPSTTPTGQQSVLERQLNSPLMSQQPLSVPPSSPPANLPVTNNSNTPTVITLTPPPEKDLKEIKIDSKQTNILAQGKENIPLFGEKPATIFSTEKILPPKSPEVIDLEMEVENCRDKIVIPSFKKRKLEILREGGLEVTAIDVDSRPSVIQATITPITVAMNCKNEEKSLPVSTPTTTTTTTISPNNSVPKLISVTVTPDIGHMLPSPSEINSQSRTQKSVNQSNNHINNNNNNNNNNTNNNSNSSSINNSGSPRVINLGVTNNSNLLHLYANAGNSTTSTTPQPTSPSNNRFGLQSDRMLPPKVTQSRSIFAHNERTVYGNPKDILIQPKYPPSPSPPVSIPVKNSGGVLDLTARLNEASQTFSRPNLEIVRVPVVPRPNALNLEMKTVSAKDHKSSDVKSSYGYPSMLDSRTMATNNLEITLVNPKQKPPVQIPSHPTRNVINNGINNGGNNSNNIGVQQSRFRFSSNNGKYPMRQVETISQYSTRKSQNHNLIPNIPNLNHLNNTAGYPPPRSINQQLSIGKRKANDISRDHQMRIEQSSRHQDTRRHSLPSIPSGFMPGIPPGNHPNFMSQMPNSAGKFMTPMLDPAYYSALYNGLFPPMHPAAPPYLSPEFSAYYKELLASQPRMAMGQHQPTVPTSK